MSYLNFFRNLAVSFLFSNVAFGSFHCSEFVLDHALELSFRSAVEMRPLEPKTIRELFFQYPLHRDPLLSFLEKYFPDKIEKMRTGEISLPTFIEFNKIFTNEVDKMIQNGSLSAEDRIDLGFAILPKKYMGRVFDKEVELALDFIRFDDPVPENYFLYTGFIPTYSYLEAIGSKGILCITPTGTSGVNYNVSPFVRTSHPFVPSIAYNTVSAIHHDLLHAAILLGVHLDKDPHRIMLTIRRGLKDPAYWRDKNGNTDRKRVMSRGFFALETMELLDSEADAVLLNKKLINPKYIQNRPHLQKLKDSLSSSSESDLKHSMEVWRGVLEKHRTPYGALVGARGTINLILSYTESSFAGSFWLSIYHRLINTMALPDFNRDQSISILALAEYSYYLDRHFGEIDSWLSLLLDQNHPRKKELREWMVTSNWIHQLNPIYTYWLSLFY